MDSEKIIQDLNRKFEAPLPEFYERRIVVWVDEDKEFADKLDEITLNNAKIVVLTGSNNFYVKKLLSVDDLTSNYLIYRPFAYNSDDENWLLDVELYSEEFHADLISMWMDEMSIWQTPAMRNCFKQYKKFFNAQSRRKKIIDQNSIPNIPAKLQMAIMVALAGLKEPKPNAIIKAVLESGLKKENNNLYQEFVKYGIDEAFWKMVEQGSGFKNTDSDIEKLASHLLLTATTRTMRAEFLKGLEIFISTAHQAFCYDFVSEWLHSNDNDRINKIAKIIEYSQKLPELFMKLQIADLVDTEIFPCINEVILIKLINDISEHNTINVDEINHTVEKRRTFVWYDEVKHYFDGIKQLANMQSFYKDHSAGFHTIEPSKVWKEYTSEYYIMDSYYREFHKSYSASLKNYHEELSDLFTLVMEKVEGLYVTWFLGQLGNNWSDACKDNLSEYGRILEVDRQTDFYRQNIASSDHRVYVIISDALRYEVAVSLADQLRMETQAKINLKSMQAIFPSITKFGMAALLPHKSLSVELKSGKSERLAVLADGQSTEANNRDKLLKNADPASIAIKYKDIKGMKSEDRKSLVKGMNVVYIYHDTIDEAGHLESSIFSACDTAITEIKNIVHIITKELSGANIIITSDHGFLYTYSPLNEDDKVDKTTESEQDIEIGRRYAIMKKGAKPKYLLPVKFLDGDTTYEAFAPRENIRIKMKGGALNFVHGGISLQEMVVPLIEYRYLSSQSKEYRNNKSKYDTKPVEIGLLSANRKISNMVFSLNFYQKDAVCGNRKSATYKLYFTDSLGKPISDIQKIIADKTSNNAQERNFRSTFNLKSLKYNNTELYYLVIADEDGQQLQREEFQIDIPINVDDFDFFS